MIKAIPSNLGDNKPCYQNVKNISKILHDILKKDYHQYLNLVQSLKSFNKNLRNHAKINSNEEQDFFEYYGALIKEMKEYNKNNAFPINEYTKRIINNISIIISELKNISKDEYKYIRGLLTEAIACSLRYNVSKQNSQNFLWDAQFEENDVTIVCNVENFKSKTVDIYFRKQEFIELCECKTTPYNIGENKSQLELLLMLKDKYLNYDQSVDLKLFILENINTPRIHRELKSLVTDRNITIEDFDKIEQKIFDEQ